VKEAIEMADSLPAQQVMEKHAQSDEFLFLEKKAASKLEEKVSSE
jgi:hypothetical protein